MSDLTVAFVTGRTQGHLDWLLDCLGRQANRNEVEVLAVDSHRDPDNDLSFHNGHSSVHVTCPKPTPWQGRHRVTDRDWWALSNARNTAICLTRTPWLLFLDDRCGLEDGYMEAVREAMRQGTGVTTLGTYRKYDRLGILDGRIAERGNLLGEDHRLRHSPSGWRNCPGGWCYGAGILTSLEAMLRVNGFEEGMDGLSMEDIILGLNLARAGYRLDFQPRMAIAQDREPTATTANHQEVYRRTDKGVSPRDKSHASLDRFGRRERTEFTPNLTAMRERALQGLPWEVPDWSGLKDWYDGQPIKEMR